MLRLDSFDDLVARARAVAADGPGRHLIGICGAPGSGKTTLAEALVAALVATPDPTTSPSDPPTPDGWVTHVPMDGFHLADVELTRLGRLDAKGAPDTFDSHGYAALLERLRAGGRGETVYAPGFERTLEQPLAGAIPVHPEARLVVTEGNYLLLDDDDDADDADDAEGGGGWGRARAALDEVWFCEADPVVRRRRLVARHVAFGKSPAQAEAWVDRVDEPNASRVDAAAHRADLVVATTSLRLPGRHER